MEWKTKVAGIAAYLASLAVLAWLTESSGDAIAALPSWAQPPLLAIVPAATALITGYLASHKPGQLSDSARAALRTEVRGRDDWNPTQASPSA